ncbi:OmpA family protein [Tenacibaculum sp. AHE15PA]|uniref:OmpA family protein n=1 Tax=unclassified Tenacibaculum TaxID=2635139 RepID=UPI001C4EF077|nr:MULTISPECIES: OmpA family protein [unclassified Tenacibaculum]QXP74201.1 OmpA family protein [Tenacibaculum sp. AHE14PA]QXP75431.1 OmpA family protein [Tenacibaculum sp. AHE15PA]
MNLRSFLLIIILLITARNFGQNKKVADRYFNEFSYVQSAELYKALVEKKGDTSKHVLSRLADSYYNNAETKQAEVWYKKLVFIYKEELEDKHLFKYAQVLRSNGKYKESDSIFLTLTSSEKNNRKEELRKENYLLDYANEDIRIGVRNLAINTEFSDFGGFLLNGKAYYTSAVPKGGKNERIYKWNNQPFLNIYKATEEIKSLEENEKDTVLTLVNPRLIEVPITSEFHESTPVFTKDGKTIYFTRNNVNGKKARRDKKNTSNLKIYKASFVNGYWINVKELPFNGEEFSVGHPALSADEKILYFVSTMPGGYGATDIYKVAILGNDQYGTPVNLGENINTSDKEMFPFIGEDNTLYFSSNGHLGLGLLDIFQSKIKNDSLYSIAENLGHPFNSKRDDFSFYIDGKGKKGFFSSNRIGGKGDDDMYSFYMYTDPLVCAKSIEGIVTDNINKMPVDGALIKLVDNQGKVIKEAFSNSNGAYVFEDVLCDNTYTVFASKLDHRSKDKKRVTIIKDNINQINLELIPLIIGNQIVINPIYFDYGKSFIREDAQYELESIVMVMSNHPEVSIKIESHTDSRGPGDYNRKLSDRRAKSTKEYIVSRGIKKERVISAIGFGEDQLLNKCNDANKNKCTEEEHQKNRRSYFYIVKGTDKIRERQIAEKIAVKKRITKKNNFLLFLKKNFKKKGKNTSGPKKCLIGREEDCEKDKKDFKIEYKN